MYAEERHAVIVSRARAARTGGGRRVRRQSFDVTPETVRRDLTALGAGGMLRRVHGGAIVVDLVGSSPRWPSGSRCTPSRRSSIAEAAVALLPEEGAIALDAGSSSYRLAELLPVGRELTVVTNSLPIASLLAARKELTVHLVGGASRTGPWPPWTARRSATWPRSSWTSLSWDERLLGRPGTDHPGQRGGRRQGRLRGSRSAHRPTGRPQQVRHQSLRPCRRPVPDRRDHH